MTGERQIQGQLETTLRPGLVLGGKYCVDRLVGKGGMAEVWAGTNERTGKRIALKVILRSFASSSEAVELFRREALAGSRVNHPNVVNVFDVIDYDGMTCIVMEMLDGESFGAYLQRKGYLGVDEAVTLLLPAMRGVAAANAEGVVHRDLKPQNIFICIGADGRLITTKVLDFGISVIREKSVDSAQATQILATHGTPAYMSPEHISGAPDIDGRADVYGFGVLFFEALTGQLPFLGDPGPALLMRILNEPAPKVTLFRPDLPQRMVEIIERAMAKDASDRFPTLDDFVRAVEDYILPSSTLPRSLTPMAGVPMFALSEQKSGVEDLVMQVVHRNESSGMHDIHETRILFTLPRESLPKTREDDPSRRFMLDGYSGEEPALTTTQVNLRSSLGRSAGRFLTKRWVLVAFVAPVFAIVLVVGWLAFPSLTQYLGGNEALPLRSPRPEPAVPVTVAAPVQAAPAPASMPTPAVAPVMIGQDAEVQPVAEVAPQPEPTRPWPVVPKANAKHNPTRTVASARTAQARAAAERPAEGRVSNPTASGTYTGTATGTQRSSPRAGVLTPDDF
ncbi:MAG TPA: serine/threonine-protein kinase [Polyangia bacterium]